MAECVNKRGSTREGGEGPGGEDHGKHEGGLHQRALKGDGGKAGVTVRCTGTVSDLFEYKQRRRYTRTHTRAEVSPPIPIRW